MHHSIAIDLSGQKVRRSLLCTRSIWGQARGLRPPMETPPLRWPVPPFARLPGVALVCAVFRWLLHGPYNACLRRLRKGELGLYFSSVQRLRWKYRDIERIDLDVHASRNEDSCIRNLPQQQLDRRGKSNALLKRVCFLLIKMSTLLGTYLKS